MAGNLKTLGRLLKAYARLDVTWFLRDARLCTVQLLTDAVVSVSSAVGMLMLAGRLEGFGGITRPQLLLMLSYALLVDGVYGLLFFNNNAGSISRVVGRGQLDHVLVQPVPVPLHFLANGIAPLTGCGPFLCGLGFTAWALAQQPEGFAVGPYLAGLVLLVPLSVVILTAWVYGVSALAFRAPYAAEEISMEVTDLFHSLAPFPLGGLSRMAQFVLCSALPVGGMAWLPSALLLGQVPRGPGLALFGGVAAVMALAATLIFRKGMNFYATSASPRYSGFGR